MKVNSYINLHWVAKLDKDISLPVVVFDDDEDRCGGYWCKPKRKEILVNNRYYPLDKGLIVVSNKPDFSIEWIGGVLAHEYRHLWQYCKGYKQSIRINWVDGSYETYKVRIINYFLDNYLEYDALLYELKMSNFEISEMWYEWIIKAKNKGENNARDRI